MEKLLTIAIPTYKKSRELKRALDAIAHQYDDRIEVLVSDDNSPDDTQAVVEEMQSQIPITYIKNQKNLGYDRNFFQCYQHASGKYVMLMGNDDFAMDGSVAHILDYLSKNENFDWIFVNYRRYQEHEGEIVYLGLDVPEAADRTDVSKDEFLSYSSIWISTLTSIVNREKALKVKNISEFYDTYFLAIGIPFSITASDDYRLGIIGKPLIAYNSPDEPMRNDFFKVFGTGLKYIMCVVGPRCGYDIHIAKKAFKEGFLTWRRAIFHLRAETDKARRNLFWNEGFNAVREYPIAWVTVIPLAMMPHFLAVFLMKYVRPVYRRLKKAE